MRIITFLFCLLTFPVTAFAQTAAEISGANISGKVFRYENFKSDFVDARNVEVWLPENYSSKKKYAVLYMHDGQMLFDGSTTWNKQEWNIDETMSKLIAEKKIRETIVVGIWNTPKRREEYMPQKAFEMANDAQKKEASAMNITRIYSDNYLKFLVQELKPFIDKNYPTKKNAKNTFIMGSSMGGLISLYAVSEYPDVYGGAGCLSTHFPAAAGVIIEYMKTNLPAPKNHKIYFDYGTETLDSTYEPYQLKADEVMKAKGFTEKNWITRKFPGDDHSEKSWSRRVNVPIMFLLKK